MSHQKLSFLLLVCLLASVSLFAQIDSSVSLASAIPQKYLKQVDTKIEKYSSRITSKTEKTLTKLSRWENHIRSLVQKVNPEAAQKLFANQDLTFTGLLQTLKAGEMIAANAQSQYNEYRDQLTTGLKYLQSGQGLIDSTIIKPAQALSSKLDSLNKDISQSEAIELFIKQRKRQLLDESVKYIGKSKYFQKINKEAYYYAETLKNYKEIFSDEKKAEATAKNILSRIPAFKKFMDKSSMLASIFNLPADYGSAQSLVGLQTRSSVNAMIQDRLAAGGPNARAAVSQNLRQAQSQLTQLKDKYLKAGKGTTTDEIPDFKPNMQKTKTLMQRLEFGNNLQFSKANKAGLSVVDIALSVGYKINDKSVLGIGTSYKIGYGTIQHINLTHQGIGFRSFMDWKLKRNFFATGGFEANYSKYFQAFSNLHDIQKWQQAGLMGITKKAKIKTKYFKETKFQLLYDMLARSHTPVSQPVVFRLGYNL